MFLRNGREDCSASQNSVKLYLFWRSSHRGNSTQAVPEGQTNIPRVGIFLLWIKSATVRSTPERGCRAIRSLLEFTVKWNIPHV